MDKEQEIKFILALTEEIKRTYEIPVIFVTRTDFSAMVYNSLNSIRQALVENASDDKLMDIIVDYHLNWFKAVQELESFKKHLDECSWQQVCERIRYTMDQNCSRYKIFKRLIERYRHKMSKEDNEIITIDIELIEEMNREVTKVLKEKLNYYKEPCTFGVFVYKLKESIEELSNHVDILYDSMVRLIVQFISVKYPENIEKLHEVLREVVYELSLSTSPSAQNFMEELAKKARDTTYLFRCSAPRYLEMGKIRENICLWEDRIRSLAHERDNELIPQLKHRLSLLKKKLNSLEKEMVNIKELYKKNNMKPDDNIPEEELCPCKDFYQFRIFNSVIPLFERERLVTDLCCLWDTAIFGEKTRKDVTSMVSEERMQMTDDLGKFYMDDHGRKIYQKSSDDLLYQINENFELVPLSDDNEHVYFYDVYGRYFVCPSLKERIYKAINSTTEFIVDTAGNLSKIKEEFDGITYYFDNFGRYYVDETGKKIYRDEDTRSEYEHDGLGNLVRIRSHLDFFDLCPDDAHVSEDCKYLQKTVGPALRACIADMILHQPADPIKFLSGKLKRFRDNIENRDKRAREKEELMIERQRLIAEELARREAERLNAMYLQEDALYGDLAKTTNEEDEEVKPFKPFSFPPANPLLHKQ